MPDDLPLAVSLVTAAGDLAARMRADGLTRQRKTSVSDIVTDADHAAETLIAERLRAERPQDAVVGEEGIATEDGGARTWYVDPVDGTYNFASGLPVWCSAVALTDAGDPAGRAGGLAAAVHAPSLGQTWTGGAGLPLTLNGDTLPPLPDLGLAEVSLCTYLHPGSVDDPSIREPLVRMMSGAATVRMMGSGSVELAWVAGGRIGAFAQRDSAPWDWYPGATLVRSAGGAAEVVEHGGHRWLLAGSRRTVADLRALLRRD